MRARRGINWRHHGGPVSLWRYGGILACLALGAGAQWYIRAGVGWAVASSVLVGAAVAAALLLGPPEDIDLPAETTLGAGWTWWRIGGSVVAAAGAALFGYGIFLLWSDWLRQFTLGAPLAVAGVALWSVGLAAAAPSWSAGARLAAVSRTELALVVTVIALGFALRFYRLDWFPPPDGVCAVEEPQAGEATHMIIHNSFRPWEFVGDRWLPVPFFKLMGETLTALRTPFIIVSGLTVAALYCLLRQLVRWPVALFATALSAMCSWNLIYARLGHNIFATTLIVVALWAMCVRVHRRGGLAWYPWIGFLSGYTLYTYAGFRGTTGFVAAFLAISLVIHVREWRRHIVPRRRLQARRVVAQQAIGFLLAGLTFGGTVLVLVARVHDSPSYYFEAANRSVINSTYYTADLGLFAQRLLRRVQDTAMLFNHLGDGSETFNLPSAPMLDPVSGVLFVLGFVYCVVWATRRWQGYFALCFLALLLGGIVFVGNFDPRRLQGIVPLIFVLIAFPVDRFAAITLQRARRWGRPLLYGLGLVMASAVLYLNVDRYFVRMADDPRVRAAFHNRYTLGLRYLHGMPPNSYLLVVGDTLNFFSPSDFTWLRGDRTPGNATEDLLPLFNGGPGVWAGRELHILLEQPLEREALGNLLQERFPGTQCQILRELKAPHLDYTVCRVPPDHDAGGFTGGVRARYFRRDDATPFLERVDPVISYAFTPALCQEPYTFDAGLCRAEWEGTVDIADAGVYRFKVEARLATVSLMIDGQPVKGPVTLTAGPHVVRVESKSQSTDETGTRLLWRQDEAGPWRLVRFAQFPPSAAVPAAPAPAGIPPQT